ncbi:MAG: transglutaminase family protein [Acidobacteriaceae bacterium]|nr:transglutaminase family protein [Acidobacteriaceae bacterium]
MPTEIRDGGKLSRVQCLLDALRDERSEVNLDIAALELASIEFPGLDAEASLFRLDSIADEIRSKLRAHSSGLDFVRAANELMFDTLQFRGNDDDYYDPRNSCLNSVLSRRIGIPITLSVVYIEVARRLGRPVYGVGLPGHFIVAYEDANARYWIDPFHSGRILSFADCSALAKQTSGVDLRANPAVLAPVTKRQILVRMLSNLKAIYLRGQAFDKGREVLDLLIAAMPDYAEEYRHRGLIHLRQLNHQAAKADFETYLRLEPQAPEREQVQKQLLLIERWKAGLN